MRIRGEQSPTSHGSGCLGQVNVRPAPRDLCGSQRLQYTTYTQQNQALFAKKSKKIGFCTQKVQKKCKISRKSQQKGERPTARFFLRSSRLASLPSPRRKKTGGTLSNTPQLVEQLLYLGYYRGAERATGRARARAAATQRLSKVISWQLTARAIQLPKRNACPRLQNTIFVQLRQSGGGVHAVRVGCHQPPFVRATTQKYVSILYNCQESAASVAATPRPWCGA